MAGSPVNVDSVIVPNNAMDVCEVLLAMSQAVAVLRADLQYRNDEGNENYPTTTFAGHLAAMIHPPGEIMMFAVAADSTTNESIQSALNTLLNSKWGEVESDEMPWCYLCDGTHSTPNLVGRFVIGAGTRGDDTYPSQSTGGAAETTLSGGNVPDHDHLLGAYGSDTGAGEGDLVLKEITKVDVAEFNGLLVHTEDANANRTANGLNTITGRVHEALAPEGEDVVEPIPTVPPYVALVFAMRSSRMSADETIPG